MKVLGFSEGFHDAAVSIINDKGKIVFASHSERFSGVKNEKKISIECKNFIESFYGNKIKHKAFFEKPLLKKSRQLYAGQLETVIAPREFTWTPDSTWHHHKSHAAGAFQTSNFETPNFERLKVRRLKRLTFDMSKTRFERLKA